MLRRRVVVEVDRAMLLERLVLLLRRHLIPCLAVLWELLLVELLDKSVRLAEMVLEITPVHQQLHGHLYHYLEGPVEGHQTTQIVPVERSLRRLP
jgi:hypothetical protein